MSDFTKFRSAVGGFNRADVSGYIEKLCAEHTQALKAQEEAHAGLQSQLESASRELAAKSALVETLQRQLTETEAALSSTEAALEEAMSMIEEQDAKLLELLPQEPQEETPDYAAMELEAYRRAEATERLAGERAERLRRQLSDLLDNISGRYTETGREVQALTEDIRTNLERLQEALSDLDLIFDETNSRFDTLDEEDV